MSYLARVSVLLAMTALASGQARGDEYWRAIPYDKLHDAFQSVKLLDGAKYIRLDRRISTSAPGMTLDDVRMVIETGEDGRIVIPSGKNWDDAEVLLSRMPAGLEPVFENQGLFRNAFTRTDP